MKQMHTSAMITVKYTKLAVRMSIFPQIALWRRAALIVDNEFVSYRSSSGYQQRTLNPFLQICNPTHATHSHTRKVQSATPLPAAGGSHALA
mmetsp:Transcript_18322/g.29478  ORF Transcript_18322/g.29478 Transcript_18322/m.29478 type:complete len:92 (-) Transcript_18322:43-318(-)